MGKEYLMANSYEPGFILYYTVLGEKGKLFNCFGISITLKYINK